MILAKVTAPAMNVAADGGSENERGLKRTKEMKGNGSTWFDIPFYIYMGVS